MRWSRGWGGAAVTDAAEGIPALYRTPRSEQTPQARHAGGQAVHRGWNIENQPMHKRSWPRGIGIDHGDHDAARGVGHPPPCQRGGNISAIRGIQPGHTLAGLERRAGQMDAAYSARCGGRDSHGAER